jgi:hypothetical protein
MKQIREKPIRPTNGNWVLEKRTNEAGEDVFYFAGVHQMADVPNQNDRIYPRNLWESLFGDPLFGEKLKTRQLVGQMGHPEGDGSVNPKEISHVTTKLELRDNNEVYGESEILTKMPNGKILLALLESGVKIGISSRAWGDSVVESGNEILQPEGFELSGFDVVAEPSVEGAYPDLIPGSQLKALLSHVGEEVETFRKETDHVRRAMKVEELQAWSRFFTEQKIEGAAPMVDAINRELHPEDDRSIAADNQVHRGGMEAMKPEQLEALSDQVQELKASLDSAIGKKDEEIAVLKKTIARQAREKKTLLKRSSAAEKIINTFKTKVSTVLKRNEAAESALEEALTQGKRLNRANVRLRGKMTAAEELIDTSVKGMQETRNANLRVFITKLSRQFEDAEKIKGILTERCESTREALKLAKELRELGVASKVKPNGKGKDLNEVRAKVAAKTEVPAKTEERPVTLSGNKQENLLLTQSLAIIESMHGKKEAVN